MSQVFGSWFTTSNGTVFLDSEMSNLSNDISIKRDSEVWNKLERLAGEFIVSLTKDGKIDYFNYITASLDAMLSVDLVIPSDENLTKS